MLITNNDERSKAQTPVCNKYLSGKMRSKGDSGTRRACMGHRRTLCQQVGLAIALCLTASGRQIEQPILVVIQPEAEYLGSVKASITNHSRHEIWFTSWPDPYTEHLMDSQGGIVPYKNPRFPPDQATICGANSIVRISPVKTWATEV